MKNTVIESVLAEEAQAELTVQAARDKAAGLIKDAELAAKVKKEEAAAKVRKMLSESEEKAAQLASASEEKTAKEMILSRALLKAETASKMDAAAEAALELLKARS